MKKLISLVLAVLLLMGIIITPVSAAKEVSVYLFGEKLSFDVPPQIINGRTLVPMRKIFESLGATVDWDGNTRTATSVREDKTIILTIDSYTMYVNGKSVTLDVAPCIIDGRTLVPARAVSEAFNLKVDWDNDTRSVLITTADSLDKKILPVSAAKEVSVYLFGEKLSFDVPPQIINGRTLVPMRKIFESLGATVDWDGNTRTATSVREDKTIILTIDSYTMYVNGKSVTLDVAPCIIDGRTLVPARAVSEAFNLKVDWDNDTRSVLITTADSLDKKILTKIGDYEISQAYYNCLYYMLCSSYSQYEQYFGENWLNEDTGYGMTFGEMIENDTRNQIEQMATAAIIAKNKYGITPKTVMDDVELQIAGVIGSLGSREGFDGLLSQLNTTEKGLETYFEMYSIFNLLVEKTATDGKVVSVSNAEAEKLFKEEFGDKLKVQHILISTQSPVRTDAEAKTIADEILRRLKNGEDFGKLIDEYNEDPGMTSANYYVFGDGEMVEEFETASKKLAVWKYTTQAVKTAYGYHIIKRYPLDKTSDEYKECKMYLVQEMLLPLIESEAKKTEIKWNN